MVHPESGTVTMLGKDFFQHEKECKQKIGVVFGGIDFYPLKKLSTITAVTKKILFRLGPREICGLSQAIFFG